MENPSQTRVLLIDSNEEERQYWRERLKISSKDYAVVEATNAERGLAIYKSEPIDCVVTELLLSDMSGFQVLLRLNPIILRSLCTPVVTLSHFILPSIAQAAKKLGAQYYLIKSRASGDDLHLAIQKAIARVGQTRKENYRERSA